MKGILYPPICYSGDDPQTVCVCNPAFMGMQVYWEARLFCRRRIMLRLAGISFRWTLQVNFVLIDAYRLCCNPAFMGR